MLVQLVIAGDDDRAVLQHMVAVVDAHGRVSRARWRCDCSLPALTFPATHAGRARRRGAAGLFSVGNASANSRGTSRSPRDPAAGAAPPCSALTVGEVQLERVRVDAAPEHRAV